VARVEQTLDERELRLGRKRALFGLEAVPRTDLDDLHAVGKARAKRALGHVRVSSHFAQLKARRRRTLQHMHADHAMRAAISSTPGCCGASVA